MRERMSNDERKEQKCLRGFRGPKVKAEIRKSIVYASFGRVQSTKKIKNKNRRKILVLVERFQMPATNET